jgi:hypothetical protein
MQGRTMQIPRQGSTTRRAGCGARCWITAMAPIPDGGIVAVTGASGYIGSHIVTQLLDGGYRVRACVRDDTSPKCSFLRAMPQCVTGRLTLHSCDITVPGVFDDVLEGAHGVVHSADQLMSAGGEEKGHTAAAHPQAAVAAVLPRPLTTDIFPCCSHPCCCELRAPPTPPPA